MEKGRQSQPFQYPERSLPYTDFIWVERSWVERSCVDRSCVERSWAGRSWAGRSWAGRSCVDFTCVGDTVVASGFATMAFLAAVRRLMSDFFSTDIRSSVEILFLNFRPALISRSAFLISTQLANCKARVRESKPINEFKPISRRCRLQITASGDARFQLGLKINPRTVNY
jgi:hypothetical protein